ncbi:MAG: hypothetical protein ACYTF6_02490 [Planctomycetota bacterium]|jgi:hypothetical protein
MSDNSNDARILRKLGERYVDICSGGIMDKRRELWRKHNSLAETRPLVLLSGGPAWGEVPEAARLKCEDPFFRGYEHALRLGIYKAGLGDDSVFDPYLTVGAVHRCTGWGISGERRYSDTPRGSWKLDYPIKKLGDVEKLRPPRHEIDEEETARRASKLTDAVGDVITVNVDRGPAYRVWSADLSTDLGYLRGIENFMLDMIDNPEWLHRLLAFMCDGVVRTHQQAETAGDWASATITTRPCRIPRSCRTRRPTQEASSASSFGVTPPLRSSSWSRRGCMTSFCFSISFRSFRSSA